MKKIAFLIMLVLMSGVCFAQRPGSSSSRGGGHAPARTSMSSSRSSSSFRSSAPSSRSTATYSSPRSHSTSSYRSTPSTTTRSSSNFSRSTGRSTVSTGNRPSSVRNTPRSENRPQNRGVRPTSDHRPAGVPVHQPVHHPSHQPIHRPHYDRPPHGMHPMPPMHHPIHHHHPVHMHYHICDWVVYNTYWRGYWSYFHTYPYEEAVVYVKSSYPSMDIIAINSDENYIYTIYKDNMINETYFTISDQNDNVLVKTQIHHKYCKIYVDKDGVWLFRKNDKKPIFLIYQDGNLYRYEED